MKFWDYEKRPYRPVECHELYVAPDRTVHRVIDDQKVFLDAVGRLWYAATETLRSRLPADPTEHETIPSEFWHPDSARASSWKQHTNRKREIEDRRIDGER